MLTETRPTTTRPSPSGASTTCCTPVTLLPPAADVASRVQVLAALADPTRLQIVELLASQDESLCVCDIQSQFTLGQPTISHHLRVLREAQLVTAEKRGLWVHYTLNRPILAQLTDHLGGLLAPEALVGAHAR